MKMKRRIPMNLSSNRHKGNYFIIVVLGLIVTMTIVSLTYAALNNPNGANVDAISTAIDSSLPAGSNPLGAKVIFAGTDQTGPDLDNPENATAWIGLFDPITPELKRNEAIDWSLYQ